MIPGSRGNHWDTKLFHWKANRDREITEGDGCRVRGGRCFPSLPLLFPEKTPGLGLQLKNLLSDWKEGKTWGVLVLSMGKAGLRVHKLPCSINFQSLCWIVDTQTRASVHAPSRKKENKERGKPKNLKNVNPQFIFSQSVPASFRSKFSFPLDRSCLFLLPHALHCWLLKTINKSTGQTTI